MSEIPNFPNYLIYRDGRVWGVKRRKFLKPWYDKDKYTKYTLCKNGKVKTFFLHRLLGLTFIPNPNNKPCIDHIDRNRQNNNLDNLRWATIQENALNHRVKGKIKQRFIIYSREGSLKIHIRINGKSMFEKASKNWTLEQAVNVRNIALKFLKFSTKVE